ncbi:electron transport complex subunit RsxC [Spongiibacter sp. KMU-166]|uniref:Ion-translocating oxidoreductase complex subunit C n=1 Tax=Spongiibacter thalassae TaxID=2721624 RepID=A0ABX1GCQ9_9GAMM|nr:electron transport complex subunit RsxC [Spongiibacter thalassae]NKI16297.1 electron transport complex subunit RsxC [Spongiibacter thalassae]
MIQIRDIHGGIHPPENKLQSLGEPIRPAGIPAQLILPLSQHIGAPAAPVVSVGDRVLKGQKIAEAKGFVSAPVHAPTSGTVVAIEPRVIPHPSGMSAPCIIINSDGQDEWVNHQGISDYTAVDKNTLISTIREAGIAGMGGAGFPSAVKLSGGQDKPIQTLILNGTECEPYITADDILMRERAGQIIAGAEILRHLIEPQETLIGIEDNKPEAIAAMRAAAEGTGIEIVSFPTKYPSGGEKQLIQILTGKEVPSGGLPSDVGIVCQNIGTAQAIYRAVNHGEPLISRVTTVTGNACGSPRNYEVLLGTPVQYLLDQSAFNASDCIRLIMGGPMMGYTLQDTAVPVVKTTNCILAPTVEELPPPPPAQACIRCGMCAEVCPVSLLPQQMYWFSRAQEHDKLEEHNLFDCIECGACSYACPSHIPLVQYYRASKAEIRQAQQDKIKAERSKERFEARQARIEREAAEKEAKRKARLEAAKARQAEAVKGDSKQDIIQAAIARSQAKKSGDADPAQAAIARAQAARNGTAVEETREEKQQRLEKLLASTTKRLAAAQEKLAQAEGNNDDNIAAFRTAVEKTSAKLAATQKELDELKSSTDGAAPTDDPAAAAIARAQAKRSGQAPAESEQEKTQRITAQIASTEKRLAAAQDKLATAKANGDDKADAFATAVTKTQEKLDALRAELAAITPTTATPATPVEDDPAAQAIARAMAARAESAGMSEREKAEKNIASLQARVEKTAAKLRAAQESGDDNAEILATSLDKMRDKLTAAEQALAALREEEN